MRATGPPGRVDDTPLRLSRTERRLFDAPPDHAPNPDHRAALGVYLSDLVRPHGISLREGALEQDAGRSYGHMAKTLIDAVTVPDRAVDLLVLAIAIPDIRPGRATATYLSHVCPGDPLAFAVCDQGTAAAFTGLRLAREYARTGGCRRSLLLIVEQAALHYEPMSPVSVPTRHSGVALLCDESGTANLGPVRQHADVSYERASALLADDVADQVATAATGRTGVTVVVGATLAKEAACLDPSIVDDVRVAAAGQPYTGVWWELAGVLAEATARSRLVLVADYEPTLGYLCTSSVDMSTGAAS